MAEPVRASELILESPDGNREARLRIGDDGFLYYEDENGTRAGGMNISRIQAEPDD